MRGNIKTAVIVLMLMLASYALGLSTAWLVASQSGSGTLSAATHSNAARQMPLFWEAWSIVEADFIGPLPDANTLAHGAIRGALATLNDPYTSLLEPQSHQREKEELQGKFGGIGVTMRRDETGRVRLSPSPDTPAMRAGVQEGDVLIAVGHRPITPSVSFDEITALVRGPVGTPVTITIQRVAAQTMLTRTLTIVRQEIELPSATWRLVEGAPQVGYIGLARFSERSRDEIVRAVGDLRAQGATRLILDLRDNGGGLRQSSIEVASQFLSGGVVMYQQQKGRPGESFDVIGGGVAVDMPLVVLINRGTASAAEIVAGALQDRGRARLVGEPTFGKGSVQHIYDLSDGSSLHVTTAEWLTPGRHQLTGRGLTPDVTVARTPDDISAGRDPQLEAALQALEQDIP